MATKTPNSRPSEATRKAPQVTSTSTETLATSRDFVTYRAITRSASPLMCACRRLIRAKDRSLDVSSRNVCTARMLVNVSAYLAVTAAVAVDRSL